MKDNEFIELINLYLDHEIKPEDAARLEAAVRADPKRRDTYAKYCRMQKACVVFAEQQAAAAPEGIVEPFPKSRPLWTHPLWTGGLLAGAAAAGIVAVLAFHRPSASSPETVSLAVAAPVQAASPTPAQAVSRDEFSVAVAPSTPAELTTVFNAHASDGLSTPLSAPGEFAWLTQAHSSRDLLVQPVDLALAPKSAATPTDAVLAGSKAAPSQTAATEMTAFKIAK